MTMLDQRDPPITSGLARIKFNVRQVHGPDRRWVEHRIALIRDDLTLSRGGWRRLGPKQRTAIERAAHLQAVLEYSERPAATATLDAGELRALDRLRKIAGDALEELNRPERAA